MIDDFFPQSPRLRPTASVRSPRPSASPDPSLHAQPHEAFRGSRGSRVHDAVGLNAVGCRKGGDLGRAGPRFVAGALRDDLPFRRVETVARFDEIDGSRWRGNGEMDQEREARAGFVLHHFMIGQGIPAALGIDRQGKLDEVGRAIVVEIGAGVARAVGVRPLLIGLCRTAHVDGPLVLQIPGVIKEPGRQRAARDLRHTARGRGRIPQVEGLAGGEGIASDMLQVEGAAHGERRESRDVILNRQAADVANLHLQRAVESQPAGDLDRCHLIAAHGEQAAGCHRDRDIGGPVELKFAPGFHEDPVAGGGDLGFHDEFPAIVDGDFRAGGRGNGRCQEEEGA